jgi:hypothetical protein
MIVVIGNAPSSGSTLLADLFDSTINFACGVELNLFSHAKLYQDFPFFRKDPLRKFRRFSSPSCYKGRGNVNYSSLAPYNLTIAKLDELINRSSTFKEFIYLFRKHYLQSRGESKRVWVEKTPENIYAADLFLQCFDEGYFLHIVRDPKYVFLSLKNNRRFPSYIAASVWVLDLAIAFRLRNHPRVLTIHYEDLIKQPFKMVCSLCAKLGYDYDPDDLKVWYNQNRYRRQHVKRIRGWTYKKYGKIGNANRKAITEKDVSEIEGMFSLELNSKYADKFHLPTTSCQDLALAYWYSITPLRRSINRDTKSLLFLARKFSLDMLVGDAAPHDLFTYLKPTVSQIQNKTLRL